ncbi:ABC transporter ATP-binding protein [Diaphorobacter sp.]|uniref:ABC transporter ATP-binding protein n=1 Tax=Diaphorobacter sp. TaxID=1934310 RepID=UPI0028AED493|nr:ABC transporter ATP-binding protein [Diaphorobacter sp.]
MNATHHASTPHPSGPTPWRVTYAQLQRSVGQDAPGLRRCIFYLLVAAALQGLALACIVPIFQAMIPRGDVSSALPWLGGMVLLALASCALRWIGQAFDYDGRMASATHRLRTALGEQLRRMPLQQLQDRRAGELNAMVLGNVDENLSYVLMILNLMFIALLTPAFTALALLFIDWRMAIALALLFPALVPLYRWRRPKLGRGMRALANANQRASAEVLEYAQCLPVLRAACVAGDKAQRLRESFEHLETIQTVGHRKGTKPNLLITTVVEIGLLLVLALGVWWVLDGSLALGTLAALFVIVVRFAEPMSNFVSFTGILELAEAALEHIERLLAIQPLPQAEPLQSPAEIDVRFEGVSFQYSQSDTPALKGIDAQIPARSLTALVGPSGSGKTTVTRLLLRQADPQQGRVLIGGVDVRHIPLETLHSMVSVVFQDVYLFDDTVMGNIRMARPEASDAEVAEAARTAQCLEFIERLPQGWDTRLGDIGGRLSGGERQRISIARALLKNAPIVVLDEPTAALDTESEVAVQRAIDALVREKTVIVIAHRLSTISGADQILVIDEGQVVEAGVHGDLMHRPGKYARMWTAQQQVKQWRL